MFWSFFLISNNHNQKVQLHMIDLMSSIIMEGDGVTQELLDTILINLIPALKASLQNLSSACCVVVAPFLCIIRGKVCFEVTGNTL